MQAGLVSQRLALRDIFTAGGLTRRIFVAVVHVSVTGCLRRSLLIRPPLAVRTTMRAAATSPRQFRRPPQTRADGQAAL